MVEPRPYATGCCRPRENQELMSLPYDGCGQSENAVAGPYLLDTPALMSSDTDLRVLSRGQDPNRRLRVHETAGLQSTQAKESQDFN